MQGEARLKHGKHPLNFGFFAVADDHLAPRKLESLRGELGMILAFEGGSFLWPGVRVGFLRNMTFPLTDAPPMKLQIETRSLQPLVVEISSFLDEKDCQHIIDKALPHIEKSAVKHMDHDVGKPDAEWRTSSTYFMPSDDDVLRNIDNRVSALTLIRKSHQELVQILRYEQGEKYVGHTDYFDVELYAKNQQIQQMTKQGLFNRLATVFFYLTDVEEGGQTNFPRTDGLPQPRDFSDCSKGISVYPRRGRIIIFYSLHPSGETDEYSLHAGCEEMTEIGEEKMLQMLKAFVRGFCTNDLSTPLGPPAIEHLTFDLLTFRGAGQSLAQLINALPSLRSVRVGRAEHSRLGPGCLLDTGSLMVLAHAAPEAS
eukprot:symbB.v1.2.007318.t1/scaffold447.1/size204395/15